MPTITLIDPKLAQARRCAYKALYDRLDIPCGDADQTAEAIDAAFDDGDLTRLRSIAEDLTLVSSPPLPWA